MLTLGIIGVGGYLIYKSGIFQSVGGAVKDAGSVVSTTAGAVNQDVTALGDLIAGLLGNTKTISVDVPRDIYNYFQNDVLNRGNNAYVPAYVSPLSRTTQLDIARTQFLSTASAIAATSSNITAQLPEKSTTTSTKQTTAAAQAFVTSGGTSTSTGGSSTQPITKISYTPAQLATKQIQGFSRRL
jgi:hypothetical protein